jgi:hypothetical protein
MDKTESPFGQDEESRGGRTLGLGALEDPGPDPALGPRRGGGPVCLYAEVTLRWPRLLGNLTARNGVLR